MTLKECEKTNISVAWLQYMYVSVVI